MYAKLISSDGEVMELDERLYQKVRAFAEYADRQDRKTRMLAVLEDIQNDPEPPSEAWWAEFDAFLRENRFNLTRDQLANE